MAVRDTSRDVPTDVLSISPEEISSVLRRHVADFQPTLEREEVGRVQEVGDGIARVAGLPKAMAN